MLMLLLVAISSIVTVGWISYSSGRDALTAAALNQLTSIRASKKIQIEGFFKTIRNQVSNLAEDRMIVSAMREMAAGFADFKGIEMKPEWNQKLEAFYRNDFLPKVAKVTGQTLRLEAFLPTTTEGRYAQYLYIANNPNPAAERYELKDARDGSTFSAAHVKYQGIISKFCLDFRYDNLMMIDQSGNVVYTFGKSPIFGTNLLDGPYSETIAGDLYRALRKSGTVGEVKVEDFASLASVAGKPAALMGAAVFDGPTQIGVLFLQFPVDEINRVMTDSFGWLQDGLGKTGEVYLAGPDMLMRSRSRLLHENPRLFYQELEDAGYAPDDIDRVRRMGTATLAQPVRTTAVESALAGRTGTAIVRNYRGVQVLAAYAPIYVPGLRWVIVAEMEASEAFAPMIALTYKILISSSTMVLIVTVLAAFLGRRFVQPIFRLLEGAHRLEAGEKDVSIDVGSNDEFADLGVAFNQMAHVLVTTTDALDSRTRERNDLLDNLLPPAASARMKEGQASVIEEYPEISILYANFLSFGQSGLSMAEQSLGMLNDLVVAIDDAAERAGIEKLSSNGATYVACCGLSRERLDHASRTVDFAQDMLQIVRRIRRDRHAHIQVQIGIDSGPATGGVVGRTHFSYYLSGETMSITGILALQCPPDSILVGQQAYSFTGKLYPFVGPMQIIRTGGTSAISAWQLRPTDTKSAAAPSSTETQGVSHV